MISHTIRYPRIAGSSGFSDYIENRYDLNTTLSTWAEAVQSANERNGTLVSIGSIDENRIIWNILQDENVLTGFGPGGERIRSAWIGATDNEDQMEVHGMMMTEQCLTLTSILVQVKEIGNG